MAVNYSYTGLGYTGIHTYRTENFSLAETADSMFFAVWFPDTYTGFLIYRTLSLSPKSQPQSGIRAIDCMYKLKIPPPPFLASNYNETLSNQKVLKTLLEDLKSAEKQWDECLLEIDGHLNTENKENTLTQEIDRVDPGDVTLIDSERQQDIALKDALCPKFYRHTLFVLMRSDY